MTMVNSSALAIIVNSSVSVRVFPQTLCASGSGRKAGSNGGSPEARRLFQGQKPVSWDVARERRKVERQRRRWRGEVGPMLRYVRPRPLRFACGLGFSFERLVFAEVGDGHSQRIDGDQFVGHPRFEKENKVRGVKIAFQLAMVGGGVIDHVEVHARTEGRGLHLFERNLFDIDIDL